MVVEHRKAIAMKAVEIGGIVNENGKLILDKPLDIPKGRVKIIILVPEDDQIADQEWLHAQRSNKSFDFLAEEAEDIYSVKDRKPLNDEV
ncbi:MAG: hypothetical protein AAFQ83_15495 [Bacteroidota bacterium]